MIYVQAKTSDDQSMDWATDDPMVKAGLLMIQVVDGQGRATDDPSF